MTTLTHDRAFALVERALLIGAVLAAALTLGSLMDGARRAERGARTAGSAPEWARATALP